MLSTQSQSACIRDLFATYLFVNNSNYHFDSVFNEICPLSSATAKTDSSSSVCQRPGCFLCLGLRLCLCCRHELWACNIIFRQLVCLTRQLRQAAATLQCVLAASYQTGATSTHFFSYICDYRLNCKRASVHVLYTHTRTHTLHTQSPSFMLPSWWTG